MLCIKNQSVPQKLKQNSKDFNPNYEFWKRLMFRYFANNSRDALQIPQLHWASVGTQLLGYWVGEFRAKRERGRGRPPSFLIT